MKFNCKRCGYQCDKKQYYIAHIKRIRLCPPTLSNISRDDLFKEYPQYIETEARKFPCKHCNKTFTISQSLYRHQKTCKLATRVITNQELKDIEKKIERTVLSKMKMEISEQFRNIMATEVPIVNIENVETLNNTTNNNFNLNLNGLSSTDHSHITITDMKSIISSRDNSEKDVASELIKDVHFNKYYEHNHNVQIIDSLTSKYVENNVWSEKSTSELLQIIVRKLCEELKEKLLQLDDINRKKITDNEVFCHNFKFIIDSRYGIDTEIEPWSSIVEELQEATIMIHGPIKN